VAKELRGLRDQCGELSRDKLLLEEEVRKLRRAQEHLEIAQTALSTAKAEIRNREVGLCTSSVQLTHSLIAPGFNPCGCQSEKLVSSLCFQMGQLVPLHGGRGVDASRGVWRDGGGAASVGELCTS
jgi:hypothetical protein